MNYFKYLLSAMLLLLFVVPAYAAPNDGFVIGKSNYYEIKSGDTLIGFSAYKIDKKLTLVGQSYFKLQSISMMKVGMGEIYESLFKTESNINTKTYLPAYFMLEQTTPSNVAVAEAVFSKNLVAQTNVVGKNQENKAIDLTKDCYLYFSNLWGRMDSIVEHYAVMIAVTRAQKGKSVLLPIYDPILRTQGEIEIEKNGTKKISFNGKEMDVAVYTLKDQYKLPLFKIWYDPKAEIILKMDEIGGDITFTLSDKKSEDRLKKSPGADLWNERSQLSPLYIQDPAALNTLAVTGEFRGRGLSTFPVESMGFSQKFDGEMKDDSVKGTFIVKKVDFKMDKPNRFPPKITDPEIKKYLQPETGIQSSNDYIVNKAQEITWKAPSCVTAAEKISKWIADNIKQGISLPDALTAFNQKTANSESRAMLMTALCRAAGLPTKMEGGIVFEKGYFIPGYWCKVYIVNNGWVPFDPSKQSAGVDADRVALWSYGELTKLKLDKVEFRPMPPKMVSYSQKELQWPVGEIRLFDIRRNGELVGLELGRMDDFVIEDGKEIYTLKTETLLNFGKSVFKANSITKFNPFGLPVAFTSESGVKGVMVKEQYRFTDEMIEHILPEVEGKEQISSIPYSQGSYLLDQRYISLWALAVGQLPKMQLDKTYKLTAFIPEEVKTTEIELTVKNFLKIEADGGDLEVFKADSKKGLSFYIDRSGRVVRVEIPDQQLEFTLVKTALKGDPEFEELVHKRLNPDEVKEQNKESQKDTEVNNDTKDIDVESELLKEVKEPKDAEVKSSETKPDAKNAEVKNQDTNSKVKNAELKSKPAVQAKKRASKHQNSSKRAKSKK